MPLLSAVPAITYTEMGVTSDFILDDVDAEEWVYASMSRQVRSLSDKLQHKLRSFDEMQDYEMRFMRVSIRNGIAALQIMATGNPMAQRNATFGSARKFWPMTTAS